VNSIPPTGGPKADPGPLSEAVFHILLALAEKESHGYRIREEVRARTQGAVDLPVGTLYSALPRLRMQGLLEEVLACCEEEKKNARRTYKLTVAGRRALRQEVHRYEAMVRQAHLKGVV
jgi:DNA-binding PadR family transcriptional regulator